MERKNIILEKSFEFSIKIVHYTTELRKTNYIIADQLLRSGTSIGANINEAQAALTKKEFIAKVAIAAKEARETKYWMQLVIATNLKERNNELEILIDEIIRLTTSIVKSAQENERN